MRMGAKIDRHPVCEERDIGSVIRIETTQKILIGFPSPAGMFDGEETRNQTQHLGRTSLGLEQNFFVRDELLGGCCNRTRANNGHLRHIDDVVVRIVRVCGGNNEQ